MAIKIFQKLKRNRTPPSAQSKASEGVNSEKDNYLNLTPQTTASESTNESPRRDEDFLPANVVDYYQPVQNNENYNGTKSRDGVPVISASTAYGDNFRPSDVMGNHQTKVGFKDLRSGTVPSLRECAYSGPPRYDWIDVESAAAIKVQSIYRRNKVIEKLEREGRLTASMRNRIRSRKSRRTSNISEDVPALFRFCGIGFLFNDALGGDSAVLNETESKKIDRKDFQLAQDVMNRKLRLRNKPIERVEEAVEVVDE